MRIVCDTNAWLSALTSNLGASHLLTRWLFEQERSIHFISIPFVLELEDVFLRPKNLSRMAHFSVEDLKSFVDDICHISSHQEIHFLWRPQIKDPKDDMVLELVVNAQADYLITFNTKDFKPVVDKFNFQLCTPKEFLKLQGVIS
jgi:putative PIN family toxin of toxin-antitoxin system